MLSRLLLALICTSACGGLIEAQQPLQEGSPAAPDAGVPSGVAEHPVTSAHADAGAVADAAPRVEVVFAPPRGELDERARYVPEGGLCKSDLDCRGDLICAEAAHLPNEATICRTGPRFAKGEFCGSDLDCAPELICAVPSGVRNDPSKRCRLAAVLGDGDECMSSDECKSNLCYREPGRDPLDEPGRCVSTGTYRYPPGYTCVEDARCDSDRCEPVEPTNGAPYSVCGR